MFSALDVDVLGRTNVSDDEDSSAHPCLPLGFTHILLSVFLLFLPTKSLVFYGVRMSCPFWRAGKDL